MENRHAGGSGSMPTLLVFGARNLGRVLARELSEQGWRVAAVARTESTIEQLRDEVPDAVGLIGDAGNPDDVERIFEHVGRVDLVVNAITTTPSFGGPIDEAPPEALDAYVGALLPGIFNVLRVGGRVRTTGKRDARAGHRRLDAPRESRARAGRPPRSRLERSCSPKRRSYARRASTSHCSSSTRSSRARRRRAGWRTHRRRSPPRWRTSCARSSTCTSSTRGHGRTNCSSRRRSSAGSQKRPATMAPRGAVAEWLGRGLQSLVHRFESGRRLFHSSIASSWHLRRIRGDTPHRETPLRRGWNTPCNRRQGRGLRPLPGGLLDQGRREAKAARLEGRDRVPRSQ